ncbi:MAG: histidinol phosphate phosphatase domain-containing protein [Thermodesulfobacteriota bacterium]|nr:histidinol phosphate phosphatase domain-containing protein [Thermodesulfobacteriota bacterium]
MIDLHTHSIFSDGVLIPSELARRAEVAGVKAIAITDHGDNSNIDFIIPRMVEISNELNRVLEITVIPGIEITHVHPSLIADTAKRAREFGARIVVVHGETLAEPVMEGTNIAAISAEVDVLAHPGLISKEEVKTAAKNNVLLEISARKGHCLANGHVAALAKANGAGLVLNTDAHAPSDLINLETARRVACGAGLSGQDFDNMQANAANLIARMDL